MPTGKGLLLVYKRLFLASKRLLLARGLIAYRKY